MSFYPDFVDQTTDTPACRSEDPDLFFPEKSEFSKSQQAKAICARCPLLDQCREWALGQSPTQLYGVWGGTSDYDRRKQHKGKPRHQRRDAGLHDRVIVRMRDQNPPAPWAQIGKVIGCSAAAAKRRYLRHHSSQPQAVAA